MSYSNKPNQEYSCGDAADQYTEDGENTWFEHIRGECDHGCPYCEEDDEEEDIDEEEK